MIAAEENAKTVIDKLNEINQLDFTVLPKLIAFRIPCNQALADHPSVQVGKTDIGYEVGLLGIINGLVGVKNNGWGYIAANYKDNGEIEKFMLSLI